MINLFKDRKQLSQIPIYSVPGNHEFENLPSYYESYPTYLDNWYHELYYYYKEF